MFLINSDKYRMIQSKGEQELESAKWRVTEFPPFKKVLENVLEKPSKAQTQQQPSC